MIILKPDHYPVGKYFVPEFGSFSQISFDLGKDDIIYLYSDGFSDQFGGDKNMKYMLKKFRELLLKISSYEIEEQRILLEKEFDSWKDGYEQVDDVLVMGLQP